MTKHLVFYLSLCILFTSCDKQVQDAGNSGVEPPRLTDSFKNYWFSGKAEMNSYDLVQNRYGQKRTGEFVLIYVTEPFSSTQQVKTTPDAEDAETVLKLNQSKKFLTGIYPYSIMQSSFYSLTDHSGLLKSVVSVQEWCGQSYLQLNQTADGLAADYYSYFKGESLKDKTIKNAITENELLLKARISPDSLPKGKIEILPDLENLVLNHQPIKPVPVTITSEKTRGSLSYKLDYVSLDREVTYNFDLKFPYRLNSIETTGKDGEILMRATLKKSVQLPYWQLNSRADSVYRDTLKIAL